MTPSEPDRNLVFDFRALRALVGIVAFALPLVACTISSTKLSSISGSYHTEARDFFVGLLFFIGAFLFAYNGHSTRQKWASKAASFAAVMAAVFPTSCDTCESDLTSTTHFAAAIVLFGTIAYFCLGPFRKRALDKKTMEGRRRATIYIICGSIILGCMVGIGAAEIAVPDATRKSLAITFWGELIALWAFGIAWFTAGKVLPPLVEEDKRLILSWK